MGEFYTENGNIGPLSPLLNFIQQNPLLSAGAALSPLALALATKGKVGMPPKGSLAAWTSPLSVYQPDVFESLSKLPKQALSAIKYISEVPHSTIEEILGRKYAAARGLASDNDVYLSSLFWRPMHSQWRDLTVAHEVTHALQQLQEFPESLYRDSKRAFDISMQLPSSIIGEVFPREHSKTAWWELAADYFPGKMLGTWIGKSPRAMPDPILSPENAAYRRLLDYYNISPEIWPSSPWMRQLMNNMEDYMSALPTREIVKKY